jgi:hypothetical protein
LHGKGSIFIQQALFSDPPQSAQFEIPADQKGIYELGNLTLK